MRIFEAWLDLHSISALKSAANKRNNHIHHIQPFANILILIINTSAVHRALDGRVWVVVGYVLCVVVLLASLLNIAFVADPGFLVPEIIPNQPRSRRHKPMVCGD